jgi:hypothetical protein
MQRGQRTKVIYTDKTLKETFKAIHHIAVYVKWIRLESLDEATNRYEFFVPTTGATIFITTEPVTTNRSKITIEVYIQLPHRNRFRNLSSESSTLVVTMVKIMQVSLAGLLEKWAIEDSAKEEARLQAMREEFAKNPMKYYIRRAIGIPILIAMFVGVWYFIIKYGIQLFFK